MLGNTDREDRSSVLDSCPYNLNSYLQGLKHDLQIAARPAKLPGARMKAVGKVSDS